MSHFNEKEYQKRETTISLYKSALIQFICCLEILNQKYYPENVYFKDFAAYITKNIESYHCLLEKIYDKYQTQNMCVELKMLFKLIMDSIINNLYTKMSRDKQNPEVFDNKLAKFFEP